MSISALTSLAILNVNWNQNRDYLDTFVPLVAKCIVNLEEQIITLPKAQSELQRLFGIRVPQNSLKMILNRMKNRNLIIQQDNILHPKRDELDRLVTEFSKIQDDALRAYDGFIKEFLSYCSSEFGEQLTEQEAEDTIKFYLNEKEFWLSFRQMQDDTLITSSQAIPRSREIYVPSFIKHIHDCHSPLFGDWERITTGHMLANFVFHPDPGNIERRFRNTAIYLDTPLLIFALGYAGEPRKAPIDELMSLLRSSGAELKCFTHTLDEVYGILDACVYRMKDNQNAESYGPSTESIEYFIENGYTASDVERFAARIEEDLGLLGIRCENKPDYSHDKHPFVIDELQLEKSLRENIGYRNEKALVRDIASVAAISRLRRGNQPRILEECRALFVTTNYNLVKCANAVSMDAPLQFSIGVCITDYELTNLLWIKKPLMAPALPRKRIVADYYAALRPSDSLLREYYKEVERLKNTNSVNEEDYYILRYAQEAKHGLMKATHGQIEAFSEGTVPEVLQYAQDRIKSDIQEKLTKETQLRESSEKQVADLKAKEDEREDRLLKRSESFARTTTKRINLLVLVLYFAATVITSPLVLQVDSLFFKAVFVICWSILSIIQIISTFRGTPLNKYFELLEERIKTRRYRYLRSLVD